MAGTICGPQYAGKGCECRLQVTPGKTPATGEAANPARICAFLQDGVQYPCDPGCCPTDCSKAAEEESSSTPWYKTYWWVILLGILFGLGVIGAFVYKATRKK